MVKTWGALWFCLGLLAGLPFPDICACSHHDSRAERLRDHIRGDLPDLAAVTGLFTAGKAASVSLQEVEYPREL